MSKTAHTPGPWVRIDRADYAEIVQFDGSSGPVIAMVAKAADADLIAVAPEAIEALRRLTIAAFQMAEDCNSGMADDAISNASAILSKLEGRS